MAAQTRGGHPLEITRADTETGIIEAHEASQQPDRNVITGAIGAHEDVTPDVYEGPTSPGDIFLLTTDGVHGVLGAQELGVLSAAGPCDEIARGILQRAIGAGTRDNATVAVVRVGGDAATEPGSELDRILRQPLNPNRTRGFSRSARLLWLLAAAAGVGGLALWALSRG